MQRKTVLRGCVFALSACCAAAVSGIVAGPFAPAGRDLVSASEGRGFLSAPSPRGGALTARLRVSLRLPGAMPERETAVFESGPSARAVRLLRKPDGRLYLSAGQFTEGAGFGVLDFPPVSAGKARAEIIFEMPDTVALLIDGKPAAGGRYRFIDCDMSAPVIRAGDGVIEREFVKRNRLPVLALWLLRAALGVAMAWSLFSILSGAGYAGAGWAAAALIFIGGCATDFRYVLAPGAGYYGELASAFARGHTYLSATVPQELLSAKNPYDFAYAWKYKIWDYSMYGGRFYLYFGPVPALVRLLFLNALPQGAAVILYAVMFALFFRLAAEAARKRFYPQSDGTVFGLVAVAGAFNPLIIWLASVPNVYNEAALAGAAFAAGGIYFFIRAAERPRLFALSGIFFALAAASRITQALAALPFLAYAAKKGGFRNMLAPLLAAAASLAVYNYARFGNPLEFGVSYQYNGTHEYVAAGKFFSAEYIIPNVKCWLAGLPRLSLFFPFVSTGGFYTHVRDGAAFSLFLWCPATAGVFLGGGGALLVVSACMAALPAAANVALVARYMADFLPPLALAGGLGFLSLRRRTAIWALALCLAVSAMVLSGMLTEALRAKNPPAHYSLFGADYPGEPPPH